MSEVEMPSGLEAARLPDSSTLSGFETATAGLDDIELLPRMDPSEPPISPTVETHGNTSELPPVDRGRGAMLFLAGAFVLEILVGTLSPTAMVLISSKIPGFLYSFSVFQDYLPQKFPEAGQVEISAIGTIATALLYIGPFPLQLLYRRYPELVQPFAKVGFAVSIVALFGSSWATSVPQLIILQGVIAGAANIFTFQWFQARKSLAWSTILAGGALGGFGIPLLLGALLRRVGYGWTIRIYAIIMAVFGTIALRYIKPREPLPPRGSPRAPYFPNDISWLRSPLFVTMMVTVFIQSLGYASIAVYVSPYASSIGLMPFAAQLALAIFNISGAGGQLLAGFLADRVAWPPVMLLTCIVSSLAAFLLFGFASSIGLVYTFVIVFGASAGAFGSSWPNASSDVAHGSPQGIILTYAFLAIAKGTSSVLGPTVAGLLQTQTNTRSAYGGRGYERLVLMVGSTMIVSAFGCALSQILRKKHAKTS